MRGSPRKPLALLATVCALALPAGDASAEHVQCGDVITADTTLDSDLACAGDGLTIRASNVTLDLGGHAIEGTGTGQSRGLVIHTVFPEPLELDGIEVRGGKIRGFFYGAEVDGPRGTVFNELVLERNVIGIRCHYGPGCRITDSVFRANGTGISLEAVDSGCRPPAVVSRNAIRRNDVGIWIAGCNTTVVANRIERNRIRGVELEDGMVSEVVRNRIDRNGGEGVYVEYLARVTVAENEITRNARHGVHFDGGEGPYGPYGTVRDNRVTRNSGDGIRTTNAYRTVIEGNRTDRNGDDGVDVYIGEYQFPITVRANRAFFNLDLGIEADPGTIDGGENRARHNGNPAQCVGVSCK